jgi:hypothetical protein
MPATSFASLDAQGVKVKARLEGGVLRLVMSGSLEARDPSALFDPYWNNVDQTLRSKGVKEVDLDICGLDYMNSSGILTLVRWAMAAKTDPFYEIVIRHDQNLTWQRVNVPVLAKLAPAVVRMANP